MTIQLPGRFGGLELVMKLGAKRKNGKMMGISEGREISSRKLLEGRCGSCEEVTARYLGKGAVIRVHIGSSRLFRVLIKTSLRLESC